MALKDFGSEKKAIRKPPAAAARSSASAGPAASPKKHERLLMSIRLKKTRRQRVKKLAIDKDSSVQEFAVLGLSKLFEEVGLPPL